MQQDTDRPTTRHPDMETLEAAVFRRLIRHLFQRQDISNAELMAHAGFCRNCLVEWLVKASTNTSTPLTQSEMRQYVYGEPYADFLRRQPEITPEQQQRIDDNIRRNRELGSKGPPGFISPLDEELADTFPASDPAGSTRPHRQQS